MTSNSYGNFETQLRVIAGQLESEFEPPFWRWGFCCVTARNRPTSGPDRSWFVRGAQYDKHGAIIAETDVFPVTGDDGELGGLLVCPDLDTVLFDGAGVLDRETWWGIADDTTATHAELRRIADAAGLEGGPRYLPPERQTDGREIARWRRFSGVAEFMEIGDRDRAVHLTRTSLLDEGHSLTEVTRRLADAFDLTVDVVPMSDDPVASIVHTPAEELHFQEFWVALAGSPSVEDVDGPE
jgi:LPPG:FO 2-phospho-L-lactate transferase